MFCPRCGYQNQDSIFKCMNCGAELSPPSPAPHIPVPGKTSSKATISLVLGIVGLICLGIAGIPALILGIMAIREIKKSQGLLSGSGLAVAGIILGICSILIAVLIFILLTVVSFPIFLEAQHRSKVSRVKADQRSIATALEAYFIDNSHYPSWGIGEEGANSDAPSDSDSYRLPTFRIWSQSWEQKTFSTLTTPVAHISNYLKDPFSDGLQATYAYYSDERGWILVSPGPDGVYDIDPLEDYISTLTQPSSRLLEKSYDPTNGVKSAGDVFRVKR